MLTDGTSESRAGPGVGVAPRRPVNVRSLALGLLGVILVCSITPYNNYVLLNTDFVGNHLPPSVLVLFLVVVAVFNGMMWRWRPRAALGGGELAVAVGMTLVAASLPSVGMMRYLPGHLVSFFATAATDNESANLLRQLDLPDWLWPGFEHADPAARGNEPVVTEFVHRVYMDEPGFLARVAGVPWKLWIGPAISWGIFFIGLMGTVLCLSLVFRRQWVENEKLAFPLASVYIALIEPPEPGFAFNRLLRTRGFWWTFGAVFVLHGLNAMSVYDPQHWPQVPLTYDLAGILAEPPWQFMHWGFKVNRVLFTIIGIMFFVPGRIAFSLWFFYVAMQLVRMGYGTYQAQFTGGMEVDQMFGALVVLGVTILWVARGHLLEVARQMIGRGGRGATGRYLPDAAAGWGFVLSVALLVGWLVAAGASMPGAVVIIGVLLLIYMVLAKVVAETGLLYVLLPAPAERLWLYASDVSGSAARTTLKSIFFSNWFFGMFQHDTRESLPVFATHAIRIADEQAYARVRNWRQGVPFLAALILALGVGFAVSGASSLFIHYGYSETLDESQSLVGDWGSFGMPRQIALGSTRNHVPPRGGPIEMHSRVGHFAGGAGLTAVLAAMNLRFAAWPLHPVGYLLANTWGLHMTWFSIFLGWLSKAIIVRYGGAQLFRMSRPLFIGLIFGEAAAMAFWQCLSLILSAMGQAYHPIQILPR